MDKKWVVLLVVGYLTGVAIVLPCGCKREMKREMSLEEWRLDKQKDIAGRHRSAKGKQLHETSALIGRSKKDVLDTLGDPDRQEPGGGLIYVLGPDPSFGIDVWELHVEFGQNGVVRATSIGVY